MRTLLSRLTLVCCLCTAPAFAAKVVPITELEAFPENESEQSLWQMAEEHEQRLEKEQRRWRNAEVEDYVRSVVLRMMGDRLDHVQVDVEIILVSEPTLSAWVYPYGDIAVHTGLLAGMENEAQLAAILGHEISHFVHRHSYRELVVDNQQSGLGKGLGLLLTAAVAAKTGAVDTGLMDSVGGLYTGLVTNGYSRKLEHVADAGGLELMAEAGYDRAEAVTAFEALKQNDVYGVVNVNTLWSSHPKLEDRIENLRSDVEQARRGKDYRPGKVPDSASYYRAIAPALLYNASLDLRDRFFDRARNALQKYLSVEPSAQAEFLVGETHRLAALEGPDFEPRLAAYRRAVELDSRYAPAYREIGMAERQRGGAPAAAAALQRYVELAPEAPDAGIIRAYLEDLR